MYLTVQMTGLHVKVNNKRAKKYLGNNASNDAREHPTTISIVFENNPYIPR